MSRRELALHHQTFITTENLTDKMRKVNRTMAAEGWNDGPNKWMMDLVGRTGASDPFLDDLKKDDKKSNPL